MNTPTSTQSYVSRRAFLAGAAAAGTVALGNELLGRDTKAWADEELEAPGAGEGEQTATTPTATSDPVMQRDFNGHEVFYSMRRSWLGEPPVIESDEIVSTYDADVVVIGSGYAGSQCFRMACEKGLICIVVESQPKDTLEVYGGQLGHFNSTWQEQVLGIPKETFDPVDFIDNYQTQSAGRAHPDLIKQFAHRNGEMVDWMMELQPDLSAVTGVNNIEMASEYTFKKGAYWTYPAVLNLFSGVFETSGQFCTASIDAGVQASPDSQEFFGYTAQVLVKEEGRVVGVIAQNTETGEFIQLNGRIGVVLATGDFSANADMFSALCTEAQESNPYAQMVGSGRDGSGHKMGIWAGGVMEIGPRAAMGGNTAAMPMGLFGSASGLWINKYGNRYCNEAFSTPFIAGTQSARQPIGSSIVQVWDNGHWKEFAQGQALGHFNSSDMSDAHMEEVAATLQSVVEAGAQGVNDTLWAAGTLEELAAYLGYEGEAAENFVQAVERYDAFAEQGRDEDYAKPSDMLFRISEPPFYAEKLPVNANLVLVTLAGLFVDGNQQVLDQNFEPIEGLYASGNTSGGRFPLQYTSPMNGISIGFATVLGALLGEHLATKA